MSEHMLLTDEERERFATYLEQDAMSNDGLATALEGTRMPDAAKQTLINQKKRLAAAQILVAAELRRAESMTL